MSRWMSLFLVWVACAPAAEPTRQRQVSSVEDLAVRSASSLSENRSGLITTGTLAAWLEDWQASRPAGIGGDLVVLQPDDADGLPWLAQRPGVRAYHAPDLPLLLQARNNGVLAIGRVPGNGVRADAYLRRYGVRADRDLVVFVAGRRSLATLADLSRAWLTLRYWGLDHAHLALVDGAVSELPASLRAAESIPPPIANDDVRVPSLLRDHFSLLADLGDVTQAVLANDLLLDVRPVEEFEGRALGTSALDDTCLAGPPRCTATFGGRIGGAVHLPLERLIEPSTGSFRAPEEVRQTLSAAVGSRRGPPIVYDGDGAHSAIVAFAFLAVAGLPARWYAASFLEWGTLNAGHPEPALRTLPASSPWRTDEAVRSGKPGVWADARSAVRPLVFDPLRPRADQVVLDDRAYLTDPAPLPAPGAGDSSCIR